MTHLDNPIEALRVLRRSTKEVCVIESQVARPTDAMTSLWGSAPGVKTGPAMAILESDATHRKGDIPLVLVPTLEGLYRLLEGVGFRNATVLKPSERHFSQYLSGDRVVVVAEA